MSYLHARPIVTNVYSTASRRPPVSRRTTPPFARRAFIASLVGMKSAAPVPAPPRALHRPVVSGCARKPALKKRSSDSGLPRTDSVDSTASSSSSSSVDLEVRVQFHAGNELRDVPTDSKVRSALPHPRTSIVRRGIRGVSQLFRGPPPPRFIPVLPPPPEMDALSIIFISVDEDAQPSLVCPGARKVRFCVPPPLSEAEENDEEPSWCEFMSRMPRMALRHRRRETPDGGGRSGLDRPEFVRLDLNCKVA
ncbi:hypothetical protein GGX14DRAFT_391820 [Mycena pura]|uniref:Uncharacterized protein n=1 Tax=Mycena pura TaxID=153505 RepID=A0AAD6YJH3_9AGAR|nr:hypothetical protein GGX14DRAFT_391820 [Mycena pura]